MIRQRISPRAAALFVASAFVAAPLPVAAQQPLSLSYNLDVKADGVQTVAPQVSRCAGFNWAALAGCGRELLSRITLPTERRVGTVPPAPDDAASREAAAPAPTVLADSAVTRADEPVIPVTAAVEARSARAFAAREALSGSSRTADLQLRFGSKHRFKGTEESGADWYRFTDTTYQTHIQNNGHKALGVELHVPFH